MLTVNMINKHGVAILHVCHYYFIGTSTSFIAQKPNPQEEEEKKVLVFFAVSMENRL